MHAAPAYTAVTARHTLQRPQPVVQTAPKEKLTWSPAVRQYVQRAFDPEAFIPGIDQGMMQERLRHIITTAAENGTIDSIDWTTHPLPQVFIKAERDQAALRGAQGPMLTNQYPPPPLPLPFDGVSSPGFPTKRKPFDDDMPDVDQGDITPPWKKKKTKGALEDRITGRAKNNDKKQKKNGALRASTIDTNAEVLEKRRQRFGNVSPEPSPFFSPRNESPEPVTAGPIIGTCQELEKSYFRLTAPPHPSVVRPLPVLEKALAHIRSKWKQNRNYNFACDQLKSIRQDLTVQRLKNGLTVQVYETHAHIALEMQDLGEYNQCQTQLRALYKQNLGGNSDEFTAYRILYIIYTCNRTDMNNMLADLTQADKQKKCVKHALAVRSALASGNYHKFFRLYQEAPLMGAYLLDLIIQRERFAALAVITRTCKPDVGIRFLARELAFDFDEEVDNADDDAAPRRCLDFLCQHGVESAIERRDDGDHRLQTSKAASIFDGLKQDAFRGVDIKGQK